MLAPLSEPRLMVATYLARPVPCNRARALTAAGQGAAAVSMRAGPEGRGRP